jgi:hypothetical protein
MEGSSEEASPPTPDEGVACEDGTATLDACQIPVITVRRWWTS